ncbi:MAG: Dihydroorotase [Planctomycetota bacterium]|jgi:dihydroorotase
MKTLIRYAHVVLPDVIQQTNVMLEGGRIAAIDVPDGATADEVIDARGLHLMPGVVDDQVHFREPGLTHKEDLQTATRACARGGVTSFLEMPNTKPTTTTVEALHAKLSLAAGRCLVNYGFYIGATPGNLSELCAAERTPGIKIFIGSSTGDLLVDDQGVLERIFAETRLPICAHCEDEATVRANAAAIGGGSEYADHSRIRDNRAAIIATRRAVDLAERHGHRFHVLHVSTAEEVEFLRTTSDLITGEACPHHFLFSTEDYSRLGSLVQMNPSVKSPADMAAVWRGLLEGVLEVVATDHAPHTLEEKRQPYPKSPSGLPAVENSLALLLNASVHGRCSLRQVVSWMCEAPARIWNLRGKGRIEVGWDADLVLVDLNRTEVVLNERQLTKCGWSPWHGESLTGWPVRTFVLGRTVYCDGWLSSEPLGREIEFDRGSR